MGNVLHVIFRYLIDTQADVVRVDRFLLHKDAAYNVLPTAIAYRSAVCIAMHRCIVPALYLTVLLIHHLFYCRTALYLTVLLIHYLFHCKTAVYLTVLLKHYLFHCKTAV